MILQILFLGMLSIKNLWLFNPKFLVALREDYKVIIKKFVHNFLNTDITKISISIYVMQNFI